MKTFKLLVALLAATTAFSPAWSSEEGVTDDKIVLGAAMPLTGGAGIFGYASMLGEKLAIAEINAAGGIHGRQLELRVEDDGYVPATGVNMLQKLLDNGIFGYLPASGGSHLFAQLPLIDEVELPTINTVVTTAKHYDPPHPSFFAFGMTYADGAHALLNRLNELHPGLKWGYVVQDDESGEDRITGWRKAAAELGLELVSEQKFKRGQADFSAEILLAREAGVEGLLFGGLAGDNASMIKEVDRLGMKVVRGTLWVDHIPPMMDLTGAAGEGLYVYDYLPSLSDDPRLAGFNQLASKTLSADDLKRVNRYSVGAYLSVKLLASAMTACGQDLTRACVNEKLAGTTGLDTGGITTPISFTGGQRMSHQGGNLLRLDMDKRAFTPVP